MRQGTRILVALSALLVASAACGSKGEPRPDASHASVFLRFVESGPFGGRLQTAVVSYRNPEGIRVDLVAAVHLADPAYYRTLQGLFSIYDAVLYELVAPEGTRPNREAKSDNLVSRFQRGLCASLGLAFQLEAVDYHRPNFVHADLSPGRLARVWRERGESVFSVVLKVFRAQLAGMGKDAEGPLDPAEVLEALRDPRWKARLKFFVARELARQVGFLADLDGDKGEDPFILTGERNKAVIEVLEREIDAGKRRIAVFYGAGHMEDMERRIVNAFGFRKYAREWITAWEIPPEKTPAVREPVTGHGG